MPDIELRLGHDMLVLSAPVDATLARQGIDAARDRQYLNLMEPDAISDALKMEVVAGANCVVTTTEDITNARLAHVRMDGDAARLAQAATRIANELKPQHVLAEIGPCGLPLDASSKASLNENRAQYANAARAFDGCDFDAFFLNGFASLPDLKCALMGVAQVSGKPIMASVVLGESTPQAKPPAPLQPGMAEGALPDADATLFSLAYEPIVGSVAPTVPVQEAYLDPDCWEQAIAEMEDLGAAVIGFETAEPLNRAVIYAQQAVRASRLPVLAQLRVGAMEDAAAAAAQNRMNKLIPLESRTDYAPDTMDRAAVKLYGAGVQFLRATGAATPAFTGALAATVSGLDVRERND